MISLLRSFEEGTVFTAFDTETTGLNPRFDKIIELGAIRFSKDGIIDTFDTLIFPERKVPFSATHINGITDAMLQNKPIFSDIVAEFLIFIKDTKLIAHNCGFDITFLNNELLCSGYKQLKSPACPAIDTIKCAKKVFPSIGKYSLQFLAGKLGIETKNAHRAEDDARVCMELFLTCLKAVKG